jgi:4,5:9,10-diseco-3-hydroxy-5,9,17-trioxoandrosta-1(10),2-diene-4-oate hydrolase
MGCTKDKRDKYVDISGINVHYVESGEGPAVLLLHGLGTSLITWHRNVDALAAAGYKVLALDLPGHGDSDKPRHLSYDPVTGAKVIKEFLDTQRVEQVSVVGSSAGGLVVGMFALAHPEKVDRLVFVASGGLGRRVCWYLRIMSVPGLGELFYQPKFQNSIVLSKRIFHQQPPFLAEILPEMFRVRNLPGSRQAALRAVRSSINLFGLRKQRYILHQLKKLAKPVMAVWGAQDSIIPASHAVEVQQALPNSIVHVMPNCGHWPHMEKAEEFNDLLIRFFRGTLDNGHHPTIDR